MKELQVRKLTLEQAKEVYKEYLKKDFPPAEIKPFIVIRQAWMKGYYHAYGFYEKKMEEAVETEDGENEVLCAYAFFLADNENRMLLLDYFAVCKPMRGSGYGSCALSLVQKECVDWNGVIIEVEDDELPDLDEKTRITRQRRIAFYTSAGCRMTTTRSRVWGVDYRIMVLSLMSERAQEHMAEKVRAVYQCMYAGGILKKHFEITAE